MPYNPDVWVDGKPEENLPDDPLTGKPPVFTSKGEKAVFLKEHKLVEVRDREHGGISTPRTPQRESDQHQTMMALKHVREMGQDLRRQAYLKIIKENSHES